MKFTITNDRTRFYAIEQIKRLSFEDVHDVEIKKHRNTRSNAQNRLYWMWLGEIKQHIEDTTGEMYSTDDLHEWFKAMFLPQKIVTVGEIAQLARKSSSSISTAEFTDYINKIDMYCADRLNLLLPKPDDLYFRAVYGKEPA